MSGGRYGLLMMKASLLAISFVLLSPNAIAGVTPALIAQFPGEARANVELLITAPNFAMIIMIVASGFIARAIGNKPTVIVGLILATVFGVIPYFVTDNFAFIMASRIGLGAGLGLINSLAVSMIGEFFSGQVKANLMGYRSAVEGLGQSAMTLAAGFLLISGWNNSFLVYLVALPILVVFAVFVPKAPTSNADVEANAGEGSAPVDASSQVRVNGPILLLTVFLFASVAMYVGIIVRLPSVVTESGFGTMTEVSALLSAMTFGGVFMGIVFGQINRMLGRQTLTVGVLILAAGSLTMFFASSFTVIIVGAMIAGLSYPIMIAYSFNQIGEICPPGSATFCTSIVLVGCNLGAFSSPYILQFVSSLSGGQSLAAPFLVYGIALLVIGVGNGTLSVLRRAGS